MSVANEQPAADTRPILAPTGNRVSVYEDQRRKRETAKKPAAEKAKKVISQSPAKSVAAATAVVLVRRNVSADSSSDSSSSSSSVSSSSGTNVKSGKSLSSRRTKFSNGVDKSEETGAEGVEALITLSPAFPPPIKRCDWITPNSEPLYICFHDEEWGTPVHDDIKLFELLILSQALAELSWPLILIKRPIFRKVFDEFNPKSVANLDPERLVSMRVHGSKLLSEQKLRAIVENAKQLLKIQQEFGSFSNYLWRFVSHKPIKTGFRHARQLPAKTPKSELVSKDLMHRGFCCVGPTVVYSFMQVSGIVNDHLITCFRYNNECRKIPRDPFETREHNHHLTKLL